MPSSRKPEDYPHPHDEGQTHWDGCWKTYRHHNCAVAKVDEQAEELAALGTESNYCSECGAKYRYQPGVHSPDYCFACMSKRGEITGDHLEDLEQQLQEERLYSGTLLQPLAVRHAAALSFMFYEMGRLRHVLVGRKELRTALEETRRVLVVIHADDEEATYAEFVCDSIPDAINAAGRALGLAEEPSNG